MSASDLGDRKIRIDVSRYAPPQYRPRAGETTIAPVLERLSRGEPYGDSEWRDAQPMLPAGPIDAWSASPKFPLSVTGRLAAAVGLLAAVATVSITFLQSKAEQSASVQVAKASKSKASDLRTMVHTVSIRPKTTTVGQTRASTIPNRPAPSPAQLAASLADRAAGVAPQNTKLRAEPALALTSPLKMWAMFPDEPPSRPGHGSVRQPAADHAKETATKHVTRAPHHWAMTAKHVRRHRWRYARYYTRRRRTRTADAKPSPAQQAAPAPSQARPQPIEKTPIQAVLDTLFGNSGDGASDSPSVRAAPAQTGAAFR